MNIFEVDFVLDTNLKEKAVFSHKLKNITFQISLTSQKCIFLVTITRLTRIDLVMFV